MELPVALAVLAVAAILAPRWGLLARWRAARRRAGQDLLEDALKHLDDFERRSIPATLESLGGALRLSRDRALALVERLQRDGLARAGPAGCALTPGGRARARRLVRAHRLWERYLADEAGVLTGALHRSADREEHRLTPAQVEALDARLQFPRHDPHGDPIPTPDLRVDDRAGTPLVDVPAGRRVRVGHVEDDVAPLLDRILVAGLHPGAELDVLEVGDRGVRVRVRASGREHRLSPAQAASVDVEDVPSSTPVDARRSLAALRPGERARVAALTCRGLTRRRLLDLGLVPGTPVEAVMRAILGDPVAYRVRGTLVALRRAQAEQVLLEPTPVGGEAPA